MHTLCNMPSSRRRVGVYVDDVYRVTAHGSEDVVSTDRAFMIFAAEVVRALDAHMVVIGRAEISDVPFEHTLPSRTEIVHLPRYDELVDLGAVARATPSTMRAMWRGLTGLDLVWVFGPHPFGLVLVLMAKARRVPVALGVRQDTAAYYRSRVRGARWRPALVITSFLDRCYRLLARRIPTTVVGDTIARTYRSPSVLPMTVSLVPAAAVATSAPSRSWDDAVELLLVGRLDQEKNPLLLVDVLEELETRHPGRFHATWAGRGPLEDDLLRACTEAGLADRLELAGYIPFGDELLARYREAHVFVHISLTEGVPQVLVEALACGTPIVATNVGGVAAALDDGRAGLLVAPNDADALVDAIELIMEDEPLRRRLVEHGLEIAKQVTLEKEAARVAAFLGCTGRPAGPLRSAA